jgi:hypothetical protein
MWSVKIVNLVISRIAAAGLSISMGAVRDMKRAYDFTDSIDELASEENGANDQHFCPPVPLPGNILWSAYSNTGSTVRYRYQYDDFVQYRYPLLYVYCTSTVVYS